MIQTKTEQQRNDEIRAKLEVITAELVKIQDKIDQSPNKEISNLKPLEDEKARLEAEKYKYINLLNMVN